MSHTVIHEYLTWSRFYKQVANGSKTFEIRRIDSNRPEVNVGDTLKLVEIVDGKRDKTGECLLVEVTQILTHKDFPGVAEGYFCMSIRLFN